MIIPQTTSYEQLLIATEMKIFDEMRICEEEGQANLEYMMDLIEELDRRVAEDKADRYNGCLAVRRGGDSDFLGWGCSTVRV